MRALTAVLLLLPALVLLPEIDGRCRADTVKLHGKPAFRNVRITDFRDGRLVFQGVSDQFLKKPLHEVEWLEMDRLDSLGRAERAASEGDFVAAIPAYERALQQAEEEAFRDLIRVRMMQACDHGGQFARAVAQYIDLARRNPQLLDGIAPRQPAAPGSAENRSARDQLRSAIERSRSSAATRQLRSLLLEIAIYDGAGANTDPARIAPAPSAPSTGGEPPAVVDTEKTPDDGGDTLGSLEIGAPQAAPPGAPTAAQPSSAPSGSSGTRAGSPASDAPDPVFGMLEVAASQPTADGADAAATGSPTARNGLPVADRLRPAATQPAEDEAGFGFLEFAADPDEPASARAAEQSRPQRSTSDADRDLRELELDFSVRLAGDSLLFAAAENALENDDPQRARALLEPALRHLDREARDRWRLLLERARLACGEFAAAASELLYLAETCEAGATAGEALYYAALAHERMNRPDVAAELYGKLLARHDVPAVLRARTDLALRRLGE